MTTTTRTATGNQSVKGKPGNGATTTIGDGWDDAPKATSQSDSAEWAPQLAELKEERAAEMLSLKPEGSHSDPIVVGKLIVAEAFGEPRYFVDTPDLRLALPNHGVLTSALDRYDLTKVVTVRIAWEGRAKRARPNQQAAFLYDVRAKDANNKGVVPLTEARKDALLPIHKANKAKQGKAADAAADA